MAKRRIKLTISSTSNRMNHCSMSADPSAAAASLAPPPLSSARLLAGWEILSIIRVSITQHVYCLTRACFTLFCFYRSTVCINFFPLASFNPLDACAVRRRNNERPSIVVTSRVGRAVGPGRLGVRDTPTNEYSHQRPKLSPGITRVCPPLLTLTSSH